MTQRIAPRTTLLRRPRGSRRRRLAALAMGATLAVLGGMVGVAAPAQASGRSTAVLAEAMRKGTVQDDIASGRITVSQLVDADLAGWQAAEGAAGAAPSRDELTRRVTDEVARLRDEGEVKVPAELDVGADPGGTPTVSADPVATTQSWRSFWHRVKHPHWTTLHLAPWVLKTLIGGQIAVFVGLVCAYPGVGALVCGLLAAAVGVVQGILFNQRGCLQRGMWLKVPDFKKTHC